MLNKGFAVFFLGLSIFYSPLKAQSIKGGEMHFEAGMSFLELDGLNQSLTNATFAPINQSYFALGGGFNNWEKRIVYGGDLYGFMLKESMDESGQTAILSYNYGLARIGYRLTPYISPVMGFATVGIGGGVGILKTRAIDDLETNKDFAWGGMMDFALNIIKFNPLPDESGMAFAYGLKIGYLLAPFDGWNVDDIGQERNISISPQGLYIRLMLGIGK